MCLLRCGLTGVSCPTVQETSRGGYPEPPPPAPCRLLMTWMKESLPHPLIMVSQTEQIYSFFLMFCVYFVCLHSILLIMLHV